jgi:hypothetical protein
MSLDRTEACIQNKEKSTCNSFMSLLQNKKIIPILYKISLFKKDGFSWGKEIQKSIND